MMTFIRPRSCVVKTLAVIALAIACRIAAADVLDTRSLIQRETFWDNRDVDWFVEHIPAFECPDADIQTTWYYRWELITKHLTYGSPDTGYVFTEFLDRPGWSGAYGAISCPAGHQLYEARWLRKPRIARDYSRYWLNTTGAQPRNYSTWLADAVWAVHLVHPAAPWLDAARKRSPEGVFPTDLLVGLEANTAAWRKKHYVSEQRLFWQVGHDDGMEFNIASRQTKDILRGAPSYRPSFNAYQWADLHGLANIHDLAGNAPRAAEHRGEADRLRTRMEEMLWDDRREFFLAAVLQRREQPFVTPADYVKLLGIYARTHRKHGRPYLAEACHPDTGNFEGHDAFNHSEHYFHSGYADLIVTGLMGLVPRNDDVLEVRPLIPDAWDYCGLDRVTYRGREVAVVWDRTGMRYGLGKGLHLLADGSVIASAPQVGPLEGRLPPVAGAALDRMIARGLVDDGLRPGLTTTRVNLAVNNDGTADIAVPGRDEAASPVRPPQRIDLEAWNGSAWAPVNVTRRLPEVPTGHRANVLSFAPLETAKLRVRLVPQPGFQVGLAEVEAWGEVTLPLEAAATSADQIEVGEVPAAERARLQLDPAYTQYARAAEGIPVVATARVRPEAIAEAVWLIDRMLARRPDIARAIARSPVRFVVMAHDQFTTDVPEHADLEPRSHWDRRARGLGATLARPATSCGEENLLCFPGDPYATENILIHEFGHTIHEIGLAQADPTFQKRLDAAFATAGENGRWNDTYARTNAAEYWAEGVQSWFSCNRTHDREHGPVNSPAAVREHDPPLAALLEEVFGPEPWCYVRPHDRAAADRSHVAGFDRAAAPTFDWKNLPERE